MVEIEEIRALQDSGLAECARETMERMDLQPGTIRENITPRGRHGNGLPVQDAPAHGRGATGSKRVVHALRFTGKNQTGTAAGTARPARDVV